MTQKFENFAEGIMVFGKKIKKITLKLLTNRFKYKEEKFHQRIIAQGEWVSGGGKTRCVGTPYGDLKISRRIYKQKNGRKTKILFDEYIGLEPRNYLQLGFCDFFFLAVNKVGSYKKLSQLFNYQISPGTIGRIMQRAEINFQIKQLTTSVKTLFVNLDGIYIYQHRGKKGEAKFAVCYTGSEGEGKRNKLVNKTLIPFKANMSSEEIAMLLYKYIEAIYGDYEEIVFVGDAARGITTVANQFENSTRLIDQFHYTKFFNSLLTKQVKIDGDLVRTCTSKELKFYVKNLLPSSAINSDGEIVLSKTKKGLLSKIMKFHKSYKECYKEKYINAIEAIQSHIIASVLKNRRPFSKKVAHKIMMINCAEYNGGTFTSDPSKGIRLDDGYDHQIVEYDFDKHIHSNIPVYEYGTGRASLLFRTLS